MSPVKPNFGAARPYRAHDTNLALASRYTQVRQVTKTLAAPLSPEDCALQSMPDASPVKWHLAHVSWFFETFVLADYAADYVPFDPAFRILFNSYYNSVGDKHPRPERGLISRPELATPWRRLSTRSGSRPRWDPHPRAGSTDVRARRRAEWCAQCMSESPAVDPLVALIRSQPGMAERLLAEHADDGRGRCRVCSAGGQTGRFRWPCTLHRSAHDSYNPSDPPTSKGRPHGSDPSPAAATISAAITTTCSTRASGAPE